MCRLRQGLLYSWLGLCILAGVQQSAALRSSLGGVLRNGSSPQRASVAYQLTPAAAAGLPAEDLLSWCSVAGAQLARPRPCSSSPLAPLLDALAAVSSGASSQRQQQQPAAVASSFRHARLMQQDVQQAAGAADGIPDAGGQAFEPMAPLAGLGADMMPASSSSELSSSNDGGKHTGDTSRSIVPGSRSGPVRDLSLQISFQLEQRVSDQQQLKLPQPLFPFRTMDLELVEMTASGPGGTWCSKSGLFYSNQQVSCPGVPDGLYQLSLTDAEDYTVQLVSAGQDISLNSSVSTQTFEVVVGVRGIIAATVFDKITWPSNPGLPSSSSSGTSFYPIGNALVEVYTAADPGTSWAANSTSTATGAMPLYLPIAAGSVFFANFSFDGTQLASSGPFGASVADPTKQSRQDAAVSSALPGMRVDLLLVSDRDFLCTGQYYPVRGDLGSFPQLPVKHTFFPVSGQFSCSWVLLPTYPAVDLVINYSTLLPGEELWVFFSVGSDPLLLLTGEGTGVLQRSIMVDPMGVHFQFLPNSKLDDFKVGGFSVTFKSVDPWTDRVVNSRMLMIVLSLIVGLAGLLVTCCVCCACVNRRFRAQVQINPDGMQDGTPAAIAAGLSRVPTPVRRLLPVKPYIAPDTGNPLPGAPVEPDCCSICLVEFEAGENLTVLPCRHFYHTQCIHDWLKRRCTCPLCKANVLRALQPLPTPGPAAAVAVGDGHVHVQVVPALPGGLGVVGVPVVAPQQNAEAAAVQPACVLPVPPVDGMTPHGVLPPVAQQWRSTDEQLMQQVQLPGAVSGRGSTSPPAPEQCPQPVDHSQGHAVVTVHPLSETPMPTPGIPDPAAAATAEPDSSESPVLQQGYAHALPADFAAAAAAVQDALAAVAAEQQPAGEGSSATAAAQPSGAWGLRGLPALQTALRGQSQQLLAAGQRLRRALVPAASSTAGQVTAPAVAAPVSLSSDGGPRHSPASGVELAPVMQEGAGRGRSHHSRSNSSSTVAPRSNQVVPLQVGVTVLPVYAYADAVEMPDHAGVGGGTLQGH